MSRDQRDGRIRSPWASYVMTGRYLALFALACFFLMPVYALLVTALKSPTEVSVATVIVPYVWYAVRSEQKK